MRKETVPKHEQDRRLITPTAKVGGRDRGAHVVGVQGANVALRSVIADSVLVQS